MASRSAIYRKELMAGGYRFKEHSHNQWNMKQMIEGSKRLHTPSKKQLRSERIRPDIRGMMLSEFPHMTGSHYRVVELYANNAVRVEPIVLAAELLLAGD